MLKREFNNERAVQCGEYKIDFTSRCVRRKDGTIAKLSPIQLSTFSAIVAHEKKPNIVILENINGRLRLKEEMKTGTSIDDTVVMMDEQYYNVVKFALRKKIGPFKMK